MEADLAQGGSSEVFAARPSLGLSAAMGANGIGLMMGPLAAGALAGAIGLGPVLLIGAGLVLSVAALGPRG